MRTRTLLMAIILTTLAIPHAGASDVTTYLIRLGGAQIGTLERTIERTEGGSTVRERTRIRMARGNQSVEMGEDLTWSEGTVAGLDRFEAVRTGFGPDRWIDAIDRRDGRWGRSRSRGGSAVVDTIRSGRLIGPTEIDGIFAGAADSLRIRTLDPTTCEPETYFASFVREDTLPSREALVPCRLYVLRDSSGAAPEVLQWRDREGAIWKEVDPTLGWTSERAELAPARTPEPALDVMRWMAIPLAGNPPRVGACTLVVESVETGARNGQPPPIPDGPGQKIIEGPGEGSWTVVREPEPSVPVAPIARDRWAEEPELAAALRPGLIVDSGSEEIRAFAARGIHAGTSPGSEALALERAVHAAIRTRDLGTLMGTASQTLRDGRGDCTEHAVLLAACCRARGIPARLVAGIVPDGRQMSFHLWTEAYVGRWVSLDATRGVGSIDPCAIALQRWTQPEDGLAGFQLTLERLTAGYRFRFPEDR